MPRTEFLGYIYRLNLLEKFVEYHNPKSDINVLLLAICQQWQLTVKENKTLLLNEKPPFFFGNLWAHIREINDLLRAFYWKVLQWMCNC